MEMKAEKLLSYGLPIFDDLTALDLADINLNIREQSFEPWQTIFDQHDDSYDLYFLLSGSLMALLMCLQSVRTFLHAPELKLSTLLTSRLVELWLVGCLMSYVSDLHHPYL